ncbi:MAG: CotH kinase family protein [Bacteroidia bacterium]|nr:CotH kinase family protein [Bacteroidia bacterium]
MNLRITMLGALMALAPALQAQSLPDEMYFSPDGRMLFSGGQQHQGLYNDSVVKSIYLTFAQPNYWTLLTQNYASKTDLPATMVLDGVTYDSVGVRFKGQTSYMAVQGQKKSFNISLDYAIAGQDVEGYETFNLNNCFQDESFLREVFYQHQIRKHIPAAKSAFVKLYINGANWGVYPNVQQLNKDFLKEWWLSNDGTHWRADRPTGSGGPGGGGWGDGTAALNYLGADTSLYKPYYTLKSATKAQPWDDLVATTAALENTPLANLPTVLPTYMDVDRTLWFLAAEVLFSDDDGYIYKGKMDYNVHYEMETGRIVPQEYDGNSVMDPAHVNWSPFYNQQNANYPLMNRLFAVPEYRQRYLAHLRTFINDAYDTANANQLIDRYKALIDTMVFNDPKKIYTYNQFVSEIGVLKSFITSRKSYLLSNTEVAQTGPAISNGSYSSNGTQWQQPGDNDPVNVRTTVTSGNGISGVKLYYGTGLVGNFTSTPMFDDGAHDDGAASDGIYGATIPGQPAGTYVRYYIEAAAANTSLTVTYDPVGAEHNVYIYLVSPSISADSTVVINELMASNTTTMPDSYGEYDDWIELYNKSQVQVDLSGYVLTDNPTNLDKYEIPAGTFLQPNEYLIVWADEDSSQGPFHANFKLSASGEILYLIDPAGGLVDSVSWGVQTTDQGYARVPNGTGNFVIQNPTFSANNNPTSLSDNPVQVTGLSVYPNPARERIWVRVSGIEKATIELVDPMGKVISSKEIVNEASFDTSTLSNGVYFIRVQDHVKKVLVTH